VTSFSNVGEWVEVLGPRISGQVLTPACHLPGPPLRFPPFYLGWGGVCRWGGVVTRDGLGVLDPDALCPSTGNRMPVWVWAPGCLLLAPHIGWVGVGELAEEEPCRGVHACTGVEGCAREEFWHIILICLEPPLRFTPQHSSTVARLQSINKRLLRQNPGGACLYICPRMATS
jgi:hypothetical protein